MLNEELIKLAITYFDMIGINSRNLRRFNETLCDKEFEFLGDNQFKCEDDNTFLSFKVDENIISVNYKNDYHVTENDHVYYGNSASDIHIGLIDGLLLMNGFYEGDFSVQDLESLAEHGGAEDEKIFAIYFVGNEFKLTDGFNKDVAKKISSDEYAQYSETIDKFNEQISLLNEENKTK